MLLVHEYCMSSTMGRPAPGVGVCTVVKSKYHYADFAANFVVRVREFHRPKLFRGQTLSLTFPLFCRRSCCNQPSLRDDLEALNFLVTSPFRGFVRDFHRDLRIRPYDFGQLQTLTEVSKTDRSIQKHKTRFLSRSTKKVW